jgi:acyl carrier protein
MNEQELKLFLRRLEVVMEADPNSLTVETILADEVTWDSMAVMGFIAMLDSDYDKLVNVADVTACRSVGDLMKFVPCS